MKQQKLAVALGAALALSFAGSAFAALPDANRMLVTFKPGTRANAENAIRAAGGKFHLELGNLRTFAVTVPSQALAGLRNNPNIERVELDAPRYALGQVSPYGIAKVQAPETIAVGADGTGIKVCIIDSGIKADHEDFAGVAMTGQAGTSWNNDSCGHGTHVAGTINAANNGVGVVGVSPGKASLHIVQVFSGSSCAWSYASSLIAAANECASAGAKIISMSLGGGTSSTTESNGFASLYSQGILSIAAAGNAGDTTMSYPASYPSVMSVAATDTANALASFSQRNSQVEIAAPGVGILSTYPMRDAAVTVAGTGYIAAAITGTVQGSSSNAMVNGGLCDSVGSWAGKVVLCQRGTIAFVDKVNNATAGGATGVIIYNNAPGGFTGTLGTGVTSTIPAVSLSQEDGQYLVANALGQSGFVSTLSETNANGYAYLDGTSMATPHVSGVAALVWSAKPTATNQQVRDALTSTAIDLGTAGRDTSFGYGLVQAFEAADALVNGGTTPPPATAPANLTGSKSYARGKYTFTLNWTGGASTVDVYRGTSKVKSAISNTGTTTYSNKVSTGTFKVCNAGSTTACSNSVTL